MPRKRQAARLLAVEGEQPMESSERYQAIVAALEVMDAGVCITDGYGRLLHQNAVLRNQLGKGSLSLQQAIADARQAAIARALSSRAQGTQPTHWEGRVRIRIRTEVAEYDIDAITIARPCPRDERFVVTVIRENRTHPVTAGSLRNAHELTAREIRVAALLGGGVRTRDIAVALGISVHTARRHVESVLRKLGVHSRAEVRERLSGVK